MIAACKWHHISLLRMEGNHVYWPKNRENKKNVQQAKI